MFSRKINGYNLHVSILLIVCIVLIFLYGYYLRSTKTKDYLAKDVYNDPVMGPIDMWSISHFLFFMALGYVYPGHYPAAIMAGFGWELAEYTLGQHHLKVSGKRIQLIGSQNNGVYDGNDDAYWYCKQSDVIMDILGYMVGDWLAPCRNEEELLCNI